MHDGDPNSVEVVLIRNFGMCAVTCRRKRRRPRNTRQKLKPLKPSKKQPRQRRLVVKRRADKLNLLRVQIISHHFCHLCAGQMRIMI